MKVCYSFSYLLFNFIIYIQSIYFIHRMYYLKILMHYMLAFEIYIPCSLLHSITYAAIMR